MNVLSQMESIDWKDIISRLAAFGTSELAREKLRTISPLNTPEDAYASFNEIFQAEAVVRTGRRPFFESLDLFASWHPRIEREAVLKTLELRDVRHFCSEALALTEILHEIGHEIDSDWCRSQITQVMDASRPLSAIDQVTTTDGRIREDASERLYKLHREKEDQVKILQKSLDKLVKDNELEPVLQDRYVTTREGRWVLPIKSGMQHSFEGIIHASSQSKQTVFMEPQEVVPINNRLRQIEVEIDEEIERLLVELSQFLTSLKDEWLSTKEVMLRCDVIFSKAQLASQLGASTCKFVEQKIVLNNLRHPLLVLQSSNVIPNSVMLERDRRILILSGPNAGGKTVLLKSVGLAAHMARCGLPICADEKSQLPFFTEIHISVGDSQSVDENLSTFAAHLKVLNQATQAKGLDKLLLIDEICGSTDPEEGAALARAFVKTYAANDVFAVITSHLGNLKMGWSEDSGVINGSLDYDPERGPTYNFFMGVPGQSLAIKTAQRVGVSQTIIDSALNFLTPEQRNYHSGLLDMERQKEELAKIKRDLEHQHRQAKENENHYNQLIRKFEQERQAMLDQAMKRTEKKLDQMIEHAKASETFRRHDEFQKIKADLPEIVKVKKDQSSSAQVSTPEDFAKVFPPGSKVYVTTINQDAVVQGKPSSKGDVAVLANSMHLLVPWKALRAPQAQINPTREVLRKSYNVSFSSLDNDRVVDVRGKNIEDAIGSIEIKLDQAALNQEERVKVIHGHGTESLKRAIRSHLSRSVYVKKWQAGTPESGGDGVTWIEIAD